MSNYRYKVTGPRGAQYLTTSLAEAKTLTKNGGSYARIKPQNKRGRGRPSKGNPTASGDVYRVLEPGFYCGSQYVHGGEAVTVVETSGPTVTVQAPSGQTVTMATHMFMSRVAEANPVSQDRLDEFYKDYQVRKPMEALENYEDGEVQRAMLTGDFYQKAETIAQLAIDNYQLADEKAKKAKEVHSAYVASLVSSFGENWRQKDIPEELAEEESLRHKMWWAQWHQYNQIVRKTARYMLKQVLQQQDGAARYNKDKLANIWRCVILATLRNWALGNERADYQDLLDNQQVNIAAEMVGKWFLKQLYDGTYKAEDFNIFGNISVESEYPDYKITGSREDSSLGGGGIRLNPAEAQASWLPQSVAQTLRPIMRANPSYVYRNPTDEQKASIEAELDMLKLVLEGTSLPDFFVESYIESQKEAKYKQADEPDEPDEPKEPEEPEEAKGHFTDVQSAAAYGVMNAYDLVKTNNNYKPLFDVIERGSPGFFEEAVQNAYEEEDNETLRQTYVQGAVYKIKSRVASLDEQNLLALMAILPAFARFVRNDKVSFRNFTPNVSVYQQATSKLIAFVKKVKKEAALAKGVTLTMVQGTLEGVAVPGQVKIVYEPFVDVLNSYEARNVIVRAGEATGINEGRRYFSTYNKEGAPEKSVTYKKLTLKKAELLKQKLKDEKVNLVIEPDIKFVDIPEGFEDLISITYKDTTDAGLYADRASDEPLPFASLGESDIIDYYDMRALLRGVLPAPSMYVKVGGYVAGDRDPWLDPNTYALANLTEDQLKQLVKKFEEKKVKVEIKGQPVYAYDVTKQPLSLTLAKEGSNISVKVPKRFGDFPIKDSNGANTNLFDAAVAALRSQYNVYEQQANQEQRIKRAWYVPYPDWPTTVAPSLKKIPGISPDNIDKLSADLQAELLERAELLEKAKTRPMAMAPFEGKWQGLKWFQEEGVRFLMGRKYAILADDRGLGKTIQSIIAADSVIPPGEKILVITPAKLTSNYWKEIQTFAENKQAYILTSKEKGASSAQEIIKKEKSAIKQALVKQMVPGSTETIFGSTVIKLTKQEGTGQKYVVEGNTLNETKAIAKVLERARILGIPVIPISVSYIPQDARWIITSVDTAKLFTIKYARVPTVTLGDLIENGLNTESAGYMLAASLDQTGGLMSLSAWTAAFKQKVTAFIRTKTDQGWTDYELDTFRDLLKLEDKSILRVAKRSGLFGIAQEDGTLKRPAVRGVDIPGDVRKTIFGYAAEQPGGKWPLSIFDEAHVYKNYTAGEAGSQTAKFAKALSTKSDRAWFLTGTPIASRVIDLWALFNFTGHPLGFGINSIPFGMDYAGGAEAIERWEELKAIAKKKKERAPRKPQGNTLFRGATNQERLKKKSSDIMLWRYKDDVTDIPVQQIYTKYLAMGEAESLVRDWTYSDAGDPKKILGEAMGIIKDIGLWKAPYTAREAIFAVEEGKKVIAFANYKDAIKEIVRQMEEYQEDNPDFKFVKVDGSSTPAGVRKAVSQFSTDPNTQVFVGQTKAAGTGLNLQAATYTVFNDVYWSPFVHEQAEDRTRRIGQERCTTVVYMLADAWMETQVWHFMNQKRNVIEKLQEGRDDPDAFAVDFLKAEGKRLGIDEKLIKRAVDKQEKDEKEFTKALEDD